MDIVSRLKQFLEATGTSNSTFADTCGIARPTLSQLLTGRNKRVSDEMLAKIHASYPSINMMWLAFGEGEMFGPNANTASATPFAADGQSSADTAAAGIASDELLPGQQGSIHFGDDPYDASPDSPQDTPSQASSATGAGLNPKPGGKGFQAPQKAFSPADGRRIVSITVFYNDNSFETFSPCN